MIGAGTHIVFIGKNRLQLFRERQLFPAQPERDVTYGPDVGSHQGRWTMEVGTSEARRVITDVECEAWASVAH